MEVDYKLLVGKYSCLKKYWENDRYQFRDNEAIAILNRCILQHYFGLKIDETLVSTKNLFPRVPSRYAYVSFVQQNILEPLLFSNSSSEVTFLDVGTGAYAIYALLATYLNETAKVIASDIDQDSLDNASKVIHDNNLRDRITLTHVNSADSVIAPLTKEPIPGSILITVCNPPFYSCVEDIGSNRKREFSSKHVVRLQGTSKELVTEGGEEIFICKMINDSIELSAYQNLCWFTSLVSKFSSLNPIVQFLQKSAATDYYVYEFKVGDTTRWIICWNFQHLKLDTLNINRKLNKLQRFSTTTYVLQRLVMKPIFEVEKEIAAKSASMVECLADDDKLYITVNHGDVWSRKFRRQRFKPTKTGTVHEFFLYPKDSGWHLRWIKGNDYQLFQSFHGFLKTIL